MPYDPSFNSSDVEVTPPRPSHFDHAGQMSINKILDNAMQDRVSSKKEVKNLKFTLGRPLVQYQHALWMRRLQAFRTEALGADLATAPTGQGIERFLTSILDKVIPRSPHGVPSFNWIKGGISSLVQSLIFEYSDFTLTRQETLRINTLVDGFVKQGRLTKKPARERDWVGVTLVKVMVDALMNDALENGTLNWDVVVRNMLVLILIASLQCRTCDIMKSRMDDQPLPYLTYGDVSLTLVGGTEDIESLEARVKIRNEKYHK